ncbi:MAG TPA: hypothetical protein VK541_15640 [Pedobacter sp.]|uniref:hypothetical protein n=1 Tax=Pedobacter sp. TaxID=1411316 RepID=UPI002B660DD0|nr:hypothetical protein [Pedobacter sp.]HMI03918.1 hypothetical protein [Pedobacter sp.]
MTKIINILLSSVLLFAGCGDTEKKEKKLAPGRLDFNAIRDIAFYEGKRRFSSGLSFNELGFQQEPSWVIKFKSNDTVEVYSPEEKKMFPFFITYDHGNVYNFAKNYFRIKKISEDSLVFQRLHLERKVISKDMQSDVHMTLYTKETIEKKLKTTLEKLRRPTAEDTIYIKQLTDKANRTPASTNSAFAARVPVHFTPLSNIIRVQKKNDNDPVTGITVYDYMFPRYRIEIARAYKDFGYEFSAVVDTKGKIHLGGFGNVVPEHREARKKTLQAIIDVYLHNLLRISPGTTLGIPHPSEIKLIVVGKTGSN